MYSRITVSIKDNLAPFFLEKNKTCNVTKQKLDSNCNNFKQSLGGPRRKTIPRKIVCLLSRSFTRSWSDIFTRYFNHVYGLETYLNKNEDLKKRHPWPVSCNHGDRKCSLITSLDCTLGKCSVSWCFQWLPPIAVSTGLYIWSRKATQIFTSSLVFFSSILCSNECVYYNIIKCK